MRIRLLGSAALVAVICALGAGEWLQRAAPAPSVVAPLAVLPMPAAPVVSALPPPAVPPPPQVAVNKGPDLPTVEVAPRPVHTIDDTAVLQIPTVTLHQKDGRIIQHAAAQEPAPRPAPAVAPPATRPAQAAGGASYAGLPVHLFGVRPPDPRDRCGSGPSAACGDRARAAVAARLGSAGNVKCTIPAGQRGDPGFVCRDGAGVDLGGLLVAEGLALADTSSSFNYLGAQNAARSSRRGLWAFR
jgi:endonuclease YncB( thermonuclease family)